MKKYFMGLLLIMVIVSSVFISGCINQIPETKTMYNFTMTGVEYDFQNNLYDVKNVVVHNETFLTEYLTKNAKLFIAFNGSNTDDNAHFATESYNMVQKLNQYFSYSKGYFGEFAGVDINEGNNTFPFGSGFIILLKGPNTGANESSLSFVPDCNSMLNIERTGSKQYITYGCAVAQATDYKNFSMVMERMTLMAMDFNMSKLN